MGPYRAEAIVKEYAKVDFNSLKPLRIRIAPGSKGRPWAIRIIRTIEKFLGTRNDKWVSTRDVVEELPWPASVRGRLMHQLAKEHVAEFSRDGNRVRLAPLDARLEAMLAGEPLLSRLPEVRRREVAAFLLAVEKGAIVPSDLHVPVIKVRQRDMDEGAIRGTGTGKPGKDSH